VDPSSLIFVAIVAIWAAYLLGHWVRRRDQLATMRSVDRFSDAMRVLDRRPPAAAARPAARPAVMATNRRSPSPGRPAAARSVDPAGPGPARGRPAEPQARRGATRRASTWRRARAGLALVTLLVVPVGWGLFAAGRAPWWAAVTGSGLFVVMLGWLRGSAGRRQQLARRRAGRARRGQAQARRQGRRAVVGRVVAENRARAARRSATPGRADPEPAADPERPPVGAGPGDAAEGVGGRSWQPVPVPPPTYTLKARAPGHPTGPVRPRPTADPPAVDPVLTAADQPTTTAGPAEAPGPEPGARRPADLVDGADPADPPDDADLAGPAVVFDLDAILERRIASSG
jgi:hypothetical protein